MTHVPDPPARPVQYRMLILVTLIVLVAILTSGCVSPGDFDKLQEENRLALQSIREAKWENQKLRAELQRARQYAQKIEDRAAELERRARERAGGLLPW